jgi:acyl-CoA thioesterase FadM
MRVKIEFPDKCLFRTEINIRITDINYGNHTGNDSMVSMIHEARMRWLTSLNFSELDAGGTSLNMADLAVAYHRETFYGDKLTFEIYAGEIGSRSFNLYYKIYLNDDPEKLVASAKTGMVCFNYTEKKVVSIAPQFRSILDS